MKKYFAVLLLAVCMAVSASALDDVSAQSAFLMSKDGTVMWEKNPDEKLEPASVTKIMTMLLTAEAIENGRIAESDMVSASAHAVSMGGSQIWLKEGEQMSVADLLKSVAVVSANDSAVALAEYIAGSEEAFVDMMNERAKELGMENTHFSNCNGLPIDNHYTTARDIALMSAEAMKHDIIFKNTGIWMDYIRDGQSVLVNTNKLLRSYPGMTGLKTGMTASAGYCLSSTASRDGLDLIAVVMKCATADDRSKDITNLLNYGFANYTAMDISESLEFDNIEVELGKEASITPKALVTDKITVSRADAENLTFEVNLPQKLEAPVEKNEKIGTVTVKTAEKEIKTFDIVSEQECKRLNLFEIYKMLLKKII